MLYFRLYSKLNLKKSLLIAFLFLAANTYSQNKIEKIINPDGNHYITTEINYPLAGTYLFEGTSEPIVELNANGKGIFQDKDLTKYDMQWGIECFESGIPIYQKGFNYAVYTLWYKTNNSDSWTEAHFSIHFEKKKMYILGDRIKDYTD